MCLAPLQLLMKANMLRRWWHVPKTKDFYVSISPGGLSCFAKIQIAPRRSTNDKWFDDSTCKILWRDKDNVCTSPPCTYSTQYSTDWKWNSIFPWIYYMNLISLELLTKYTRKLIPEGWERVKLKKNMFNGCRDKEVAYVAELVRRRFNLGTS